MKNNVLSALVVFFAVVACLLIIDDLSQGINKSQISSSDKQLHTVDSNQDNLATLDLDVDQ